MDSRGLRVKPNFSYIDVQRVLRHYMAETYVKYVNPLDLLYDFLEHCYAFYLN